MESDHDWHLFDATRGWEVRRVGDEYHVRLGSAGNAQIVLTAAEFDQWRAEGPNPPGLD